MWVWLQAGLPWAVWKPPVNQPQVTPLSFSRLPTLRPDIATLSRVVHTSPLGCGSPVTVPSVTSVLGPEAPWVWPDTRLSAPTVEGPKLVPYELSLIAKRWA